MRAHFGLPSVTAEDTEGKPPIQVKFEIPYFTTSGIQVYFLRKQAATLMKFRFYIQFKYYENVFFNT